jgi:hypothetical protein
MKRLQLREQPVEILRDHRNRCDAVARRRCVPQGPGLHEPRVELNLQQLEPMLGHQAQRFGFVPNRPNDLAGRSPQQLPHHGGPGVKRQDDVIAM